MTKSISLKSCQMPRVETSVLDFEYACMYFTSVLLAMLLQLTKLPLVVVCARIDGARSPGRQCIPQTGAALP